MEIIWILLCTLRMYLYQISQRSIHRRQPRERHLHADTMLSDY